MPELSEQDDERVVGVDDDADYRAEMFGTYRVMKWKPEDLTDAEEQEDYRRWLEENKDDEG